MDSRPTIVLEGGLGNRMRVAAAAYSMSLRLGMGMRVLWTRQWGMHCRLDQLFQPFDDEAFGFSMHDAEGWERFVLTRPKLSNLYLPRLLQHLSYRNIILSPQIYYLNEGGFDYESWFRRGSNLMFAYRHFCEWEPEVLRLLFHPIPSVLNSADALCQSFTSHTIGCHIRRTDNKQSIDESPTELFISTLDKDCELNDDTRIFLATDDYPTKQLLLRRYGTHRLICQPQQTSRDSVTGIQDALVEMIALSRTSHVYGTAGSTFSEIATLWGGIPLTILRNNM